MFCARAKPFNNVGYHFQAKMSLGISMQVNLMDVDEEGLRTYFAGAMNKVRLLYF